MGKPTWKLWGGRVKRLVVQSSKVRYCKRFPLSTKKKLPMYYSIWQ